MVNRKMRLTCYDIAYLCSKMKSELAEMTTESQLDARLAKLKASLEKPSFEFMRKVAIKYTKIKTIDSNK